MCSVVLTSASRQDFCTRHMMIISISFPILLSILLIPFYDRCVAAAPLVNDNDGNLHHACGSETSKILGSSTRPNVFQRPVLSTLQPDTSSYTLSASSVTSLSPSAVQSVPTAIKVQTSGVSHNISKATLRASGADQQLIF